MTEAKSSSSLPVMTIDTKPGNQAFSDAMTEASLSERNGRASYVQQFEKRLGRMRLLPESLRAESFTADDPKIFPKKFASAVLWARFNIGDFDLLLGHKTESEYRQKDHNVIRKEYGLEDGFDTWSGFLITGEEGEKEVRFLGLSKEALDKVLQFGSDVVLKTLKDYGISAIIVAGENDNLVPTSEAERHLGLVTGGYVQALMEKVVDNGWLSQLAETYGWTNTELLRFRLSGEYPEDKMLPIRP